MAQPRRQDVSNGRRIRNPRFERIVDLARTALIWERLWRVLLPPILLIGLFLSLSWAGLWLLLPHWARGLGVLGFALALIAALLPFRKIRAVSRKEALARIDRASGFTNRPAATLEDRLANAADDPATRALWNLHRQRAEATIASLKAGLPSPRMVDFDRYALRAFVLVALFASAFVAGPEKYARVAAAFDWRLSASARAGYRLDAWIDPPAYTGKTPILLNIATTDPQKPQRLEAPAGSTVIIRSSGGEPGFETKGALAEAPPDAKETQKPEQTATANTDTEKRLILRGDASLTLLNAGSPLATFEIAAIPDRPPTITLAEVPRANARGSLTLGYTISDDYGVIGAEANFANPSIDGKTIAHHSLVDPPKAVLVLPPGPGGLGEAETTADLSDHPWAGARVEMTLSARDEGGNEGKSEPVAITLPQKPFVKPLARALVEQRRNLVLAPEQREKVRLALEALMIAPEAFETSASVFLGLRVASERLQAAKSDADLVEVADFLWEMALRIENGDLSQAERDLRAAEQELREALERNAPEEEIRKLTENLRAAMDKFLNELAEQQRQQGQQEQAEAPANQSRTISPKDLRSMLDKMQEMARSGNQAEAQRMLEQLQNILENLQTARRSKPDPKMREMSRALDDLNRMSQEQQDLRDDTYRDGEAEQAPLERQRQMQNGSRQHQPGQKGARSPNGQDQDADDEAGNDPRQNPRAHAQPKSEAELRQRQQALRDRLEKLQNRLKQAGQSEPSLNDAQGAMEEAEKALRNGPEGRDDAVEAQGRALESMREGAEKLAENMRQQGEGEGESADSEDGDQEGQGSPGRQGRAGGSDPLGRPMASSPMYNPRARFDPMGVPAAQRAQRVLEELRRRLSDPSRPREEMDYLERLLRRY